MHPVIAILAYPFFAIELFAAKSATEFPHARTVIPKNAGFRPEIYPSNYKRSTKIPQIKLIQTIPIMNAMKAKRRISLGGLVS